MEAATREKLKKVLDKNSDLQREALAAQQKRETEERERAEKRAAARDQWPKTLVQLRAAVVELNEEVEGAGLSFKVFEGSAPLPAISQTFVTLLPKGEEPSERQVVFNVNAYGRVSPVFLIPHSGKAPASFNLIEATQELLAAIMVDFLDQVMAYKAKKR